MLAAAQGFGDVPLVATGPFGQKVVQCVPGAAFAARLKIGMLPLPVRHTAAQHAGEGVG